MLIISRLKSHVNEIYAQRDIFYTQGIRPSWRNASEESRLARLNRKKGK